MFLFDYESMSRKIKSISEIQNKNAFFCHRMFRNCFGGGLLVYLRNDIPCRRILNFETKTVETIVLETIIAKTKWCITFGYKLPKTTDIIFTNEMHELCNSVNALYDNYVILGDLNFNVLNVKINFKNTSDTIICPLRNLCSDLNLKKLIHEPTFYHRTGNSLLDVLVTNQYRRFASAGAIQNEISDGHSLIYGALRLKCPKLTPVDIEFRSFKNFDKDNFLIRICRVPPSLSLRFLMSLGIPSGSLFINLLKYFMNMFRLRGNALEINNQPFLTLNLKKLL